MSDTTLEAVVALVRRSVRVPADVPLDAATRLIGGGLALSSIQVLELSVAVEDHFALVLAQADLRAFQSIGALAALVAGRRGGG